MAETFTWTPSFGAQKNIKPEVQTVKFGGYEQRTTFGLNTLPQIWNLTFNNRDQDESEEIEAFLQARGGTEAFYWTPFDAEDQVAFVCAEWSKSITSGVYYTFTMQFRQVFEAIG